MAGVDSRANERQRRQRCTVHTALTARGASDCRENLLLKTVKEVKSTPLPEDQKRGVYLNALPVDCGCMACTHRLSCVTVFFFVFLSCVPAWQRMLPGWAAARRTAGRSLQDHVVRQDGQVQISSGADDSQTEMLKRTRCNRKHEAA